MPSVFLDSRKAVKHHEKFEERQTYKHQIVISKIHIDSRWLQSSGAKRAKIPYIIGLRIHKNKINVKC